MSYEKWSPELISRRLLKENMTCVSHETIYKWIWLTKHSNHRDHKEYKSLHKHLRHHSRRQKRGNVKDNRGAITSRVDISKRPTVVKDRTRIGDIEVDLMLGANHKSALLLMTDRATMVTMIEKLESKNAEEINDKILKRLNNFSSSWIKTITYDNGKRVC